MVDVRSTQVVVETIHGEENVKATQLVVETIHAEVNVKATQLVIEAIFVDPATFTIGGAAGWGIPAGIS